MTTKIKVIFACIIIFLSGFNMICYAQPKIPKENIPPNIDNEVRREIELLYSENPAERGMAAYKLGKFGSKAAAAVPFLKEIQNDETKLVWLPIGMSNYYATDKRFARPTSVKWETEQALMQIGEGDIEVLIKTLENEKEDRLKRFDAAGRLGYIRDRRAVNALVSALKDSDLSIRWAAAEALGEIKDKAAVEPLVDTLRDEDSFVRYKAAGALRNLGETKQAAELLTIDLKKGNPSDRKKAAETLGDLRNEAAVSGLIEILNDKDESVKKSAIEALGEIGGERAAKSLILLLQDNSINVRGGCGRGAW